MRRALKVSKQEPPAPSLAPASPPSSPLSSPLSSPPSARDFSTSSSDAMAEFLRTYERRIEAMVHQLAPRDEALRQELRQAVLIAVWQADVSRYRDDEMRLLIHRVYDRIRNSRRDASRRARGGGRYVSLGSLDDFEDAIADAAEPRHMRRARGRQYDPQDPSSEEP